jgi:hypothetical protein
VHQLARFGLVWPEVTSSEKPTSFGENERKKKRRKKEKRSALKEHCWLH